MTERENQLGGSLIRKIREQKEGSGIHEGQAIIQRDSGKVFVIKSINHETDRCTLSQDDGSATVTKAMSTLEQDLATAGSAWRLKE